MESIFKYVNNNKTDKNHELLDNADELSTQGKFNEALDILDKIPSDCEQYPNSLLLKSMILAIEGNREESLEIFERFFAIHGFLENKDMEDSDKLYMYGLSLFFNEEYGNAIKFFNASLRLNPNQSEVLFYKSSSFAFLGRFKKAIKIIDDAIRLDSNNSNFWNNKGAFLSELNFIGKAHKAFDKAISIEPNSDSWSNKGVLYCRNDDFDHALHCFDEAIKLNPNDIDSIVGKASIYSELKDYEKADECFDRAEKIDANDITYLAEKGKHLLNQDEFQKSIEYFNECLKIDDEVAVVWMYKAMALSALNCDEESEKCAKKALELDPNSLSVLDEVVIIED
jgi:tetratricopeptide (TPR) repeat protein